MDINLFDQLICAIRRSKDFHKGKIKNFYDLPPVVLNSIISLNIGMAGGLVYEYIVCDSIHKRVEFLVRARIAWIASAAIVFMAIESIDQKLCLLESDDRGAKTDEDLTKSIVFDLMKERQKQDEKFGIQAHSLEVWQAIIVEEMGEASKEILDVFFSQEDEKTISAIRRLRYEWIQTCASLIAALECSATMFQNS